MTWAKTKSQYTYIYFFNIKKTNEKFIYKFFTLGYKSISYAQECATDVIQTEETKPGPI